MVLLLLPKPSRHFDGFFDIVAEDAVDVESAIGVAGTEGTASAGVGASEVLYKLWAGSGVRDVRLISRASA